MITYLDTSALVKLYVTEKHSSLLRILIKEQAQVIGVSLIARPEFTASMAKGVRTGLIWKNVANLALERFRVEWQDLRILLVTHEVIETADELAWEYGIRGFDAIHLASALHWQNIVDESILFISFDKQLWQAAQQAGLNIWPQSLS